ncbi:hypothetical protein [Endozoicomonas sp. ALC066]|uniref:hypothetical protein n=1 Tax=Endozoicomonas sp. ALC066 TaxID=3403078 RepID=UPI003BB6DC1D
MALGSPVTNSYQIGTAELRVGPLNKAGMLTQAHSVGLVDQVTISVSQEASDLMGGFPQKKVDTAIVSQSMSISGTLREFSRRNIQTLLGEGVSETQPSAASTTLAANASVGATSISVATGDGAKFKAGDLIVIYPAGVPENLSICKVESVSADDITLATDLPTLFDYDSGAMVYSHEPIAIGAVSKTNYMAVQVIQKDNNTGSPKIFQAWKASVSSGMEYATSTSDFGSTELTLECLEPAAIEFGTDGPLNHLKDIIPMYPTGMFVPGA